MDWRSMDNLPDRDMPVLLWFGNREWLGEGDRPVSFGEVRDTAEKVDVAFYERGTWCYAGTGHDVHEPGVVDYPTAWAPLIAPTKGT